MADAPVVVVAGPTASGKSGLAIEIAERLDGEIVNADSMQVYRDLRVLTARPGREEEGRVPHRLYGYRDAAEPGSAADWANDALAAIADIRGKGRRPLVVGGTGLYLRTLMEGIAPVPEVPGEVRARARARRLEIGDIAFHNELAARDPVIAERLHPGDSQRVLRAWEVFETTGQPLSQWQAQPATPPDLAFRIVVLLPPRDELYRVCDARFLDMLATDALDEVERLAGRAVDEALDPALPIFKALGFAPLAAHLRGELTLDAATGLAQQQTRNYAKRQYTWLRHQLPESGATRSRIQKLELSFAKQDEIFSFLS